MMVLLPYCPPWVVMQLITATRKLTMDVVIVSIGMSVAAAARKLYGGGRAWHAAYLLNQPILPLCGLVPHSFGRVVLS